MTIETNAYGTFDAIGNKEDVSNVIYNVDPHETPFMSKIAKVKATATNHEWQTDVLDSPSATNYALQGQAYSADAVVPTVRLSNYTQISDKQYRVTGTQEAVQHYGRESELDYQTVLKGKALKNDMESALFANNTKVAAAAATVPELAGIPAWMTSNVSRGATGSSGGLGTAASPGTQRAFTETLLKTVLQSIWANGGNPDTIYLGGFNKQVMSTFTGNATRFNEASTKKVVASIEVYQSDFGELKVVPARHIAARDCLILQTDMFALAELRPMEKQMLAKTGDSQGAVLLAEYTLEVRNQKSSGHVADLTTS
jgi:hypothetical protein